LLNRYLAIFGLHLRGRRGSVSFEMGEASISSLSKSTQAGRSLVSSSTSCYNVFFSDSCIRLAVMGLLKIGLVYRFLSGLISLYFAIEIRKGGQVLHVQGFEAVNKELSEDSRQALNVYSSNFW